MSNLDADLKHPLNKRVLTCPVQGSKTSFQLVDELGEGLAYAGLAYEIVDAEGHIYTGTLDGSGSGEIDHFAGPLALSFKEPCHSGDDFYEYLKARDYYPLPITELQVRAEKTRYFNKNGSRTSSNPAQACADAYFQVEVRNLVEHCAHLPPTIECNYPPKESPKKLMRGNGKRGVCLLPKKHNVLEVRPLRALSPIFSTDSKFCALNLYQLAIMATLSYNQFGQRPRRRPLDKNFVSYPKTPSMGNWFGDALAKFDEVWKVDSGQLNAHYPLYEEVSYSKRFEIVPFDPELYPLNHSSLNEEQETPESIHFLDDRGHEIDTDTQAFITHSKEVILISVRGTNEIIADGLRDADALQVDFKEGPGKVHRGFYGAAEKVYQFTLNYLEKFYIGQKLLICGHSLGGAITLLLSEMLRCRPGYNYDIVLYTYGAPRAADATFIKSASDLVHYRMVNHNDPVPSVPGTWMNTKHKVYGAGAVLTFLNVPAGISIFAAGITNLSSDPYQHHGKLRHFFPVELGRKEKSSILWEPGCDTITQHAACELAVKQVDGLPNRPGLLSQAFHAGNHSMVGGYIPACWAALRRWQDSLKHKRSLVTEREFEFIDTALSRITEQLRNRRRDLNSRGDKYRETHGPAVEAFSQEIDKVQQTRDRLAILRRERITDANVYGSFAQHAELDEHLARWTAHPENRIDEQLAMAPAAAESDHEVFASILGRPIGTPHTLDIDSFI
ncbi:hypothetical protein HDC30_004112 [Pseudomonas sp. JAI115]|uniref:lipase family protein n=1 Tax=Pseudomonas sp. JAI115 TaxID=2723061 RepID=UPI00161A45D1|nr:lipase family protein [Pseudomonas sp. JAI115]MBB6156869.1 hypothetical protein [Pseudomonas sp. JAI115]